MYRLLLLGHNQVGRGTYWRSSGFAKGLAKLGHNVTYISAAPPTSERDSSPELSNVNSVQMPSLFSTTRGSGYDPLDLFARLRWINNYVKNNEIDLVHAFESRPTTFIPALRLRNRDVCFVSDWCDWFGKGGSVEERTNFLVRNGLRPVETYFENRSRRYADGVTVINHVLRVKARQLGVRDEKIFSLPNGIDTMRFKPKDRADSRRRLGLDLEATIIAYTGSIFHQDALLMAAAFDRINSEIPNSQLLMVGYGKVAIDELVAAPGAVIHTGPVSLDELVDYVAASTLCWLPLANSEANAGRFPMKLNDYMASGRAVVATDVGDIGDFVRTNRIGLVSDATPSSLAAAVLTLAHNEELRQSIELRARHVAQTKLAWPVVTKRLEEIYAACLTANRK